MTIARDIRTGEVVGQVLDRQPGIRGPMGTAVPQVLLLTRDGYRTMSVWDVRLEEIPNR